MNLIRVTFDEIYIKEHIMSLNGIMYKNQSKKIYSFGPESLEFVKYISMGQ